MGRPSKYTDALATEICERLAAGESLNAICMGEDMPHERTVRGWVIDKPEFSPKYTRARDIGLDRIADEVLTIADDATADPARSRIRFDARRWYLSKLAPKRYGDRITAEHTGADGGPIEQSITVSFVKAKGE